MVEGRSKQAFKTWLAEREESWRQAVEVVAMDGFTGFKTATSEELPDAVAAGLQDLAGRTRRILAPGGGSGGDGRVHRV